MISIKKGIELPIQGGLNNHTVHKVSPTKTVAVLGDDFIGLKPTMMVQEGDKVKKGQPLFEDKKTAGVFVCAPVSGVVQSIARGERRRLLSVIIKPEGEESITFEPLKVETIAREDVVNRLVESGLWTALRARPFNRLVKLDGKPFAIFVNTMDSNPLALDPLIALEGRENDYLLGLKVLEKLTDGNIYVCHKPQAQLPQSDVSRVKLQSFSGVHPAGLVGTHIHFLEPVSLDKIVWHIGLQDLLAFGQLFREGTIDNERLVALVGPGLKEPKIIKTTQGASLEELVQGNLHEGKQRLISGSVFSGRQAFEDTAYLGQYDQQIFVLPEGGESVFLEFMRPGKTVFSKTNAYLGKFLGEKLPFTTALQGSPRPILPFGVYETVMPLDILPALLLKALVVKDTEAAVQLGALELVEEDIALLTYVDPGKHDFGAILRENLTLIEQEG